MEARQLELRVEPRREPADMMVRHIESHTSMKETGPDASAPTIFRRTRLPVELLMRIPSPPLPDTTPDRPECPTCGKPMVLRRAKSGKNVGQERNLRNQGVAQRVLEDNDLFLQSLRARHLNVILAEHLQHARSHVAR